MECTSRAIFRNFPLVILEIAFFLTASIQAQMPPNSSTTSTPVPGVGHDYLGAMGETVNPATGSVSIRISTTMPRGRGLTLPFEFTYDSSGTNYVTNFTNGSLEWGLPSSTVVSSGGWSESVPVVSGSTLSWTAIGDGGAKFHCYAFVNYVYQDPSGDRHNLNVSTFSGNNPNSACTYDTTHWPSTFTGIFVPQGGEADYAPDPIAGGIIASIPAGNGAGVPQGPVTVSQPDGTMLYFNTSQFAFGAMASSVEDRNGNVVTINKLSSGYNYVDTLGRTVLQDSGFAVSPETVTISGYNAPFSLSWTALSTPSFVAPMTTLSGSCGLGHATWYNPVTDTSLNAISTLTLPNGKSYSFSYDPTYQVINKVVYPTGGYVRYVWGMNSQSDYGFSLNQTAPCSVIYGVPAITDRYVSFNGTTEVLHQQFSYSTTWNINNQNHTASVTSKQTTVTTYDLVRNNSFSTIYTYSGGGEDASPPNGSSPTPDYQPLESSIAYYDTNGSLLKTVYKNWLNARVLLSEKTQYPSGQASETTWSYNNREQQTERDDYDFGAAGVGPLLRKTITNYQQFADTPLYPNGPSIVDEPCQVVMYDSSGTNRMAETDYFYDNGGTGTVCGAAGNAATTGAGGSSLTGHNVTFYSASSTNPRGNLTAKIQWLNTGSSPLTTYTYDETGQTRSMTDPNQNQYTYAYADQFLSTNTNGYTTTAGSPPSGTVTNTYVTQITRPAANGVAHITKFAYGYNDGELTQVTDENSQLTTYRYNDSLGRLTETDYPDTGQTSLAFNDSVPSITTTKLLNSSTSVSTTVTLDGLNHPVQSQLTTDPMGATSTATVYDGLGRTYESFNPTRCSPPTTNCGSETTWGYVTYTYDVLGRTTKISQADGSPVTISYAGNCTTVTDEAGRSRKSCVDGLGRMTGVWEDPAGVNYETDYTYDALGNLTNVNQKGNNNSNARIRSFQYDSLSRLTSATNPESGTITYGYDANGNVITKTAPAPNQTGPATVTTAYSNDALNRITEKSYSDGTTPAAYFQYDTSEGWGNPPFPQNNIVGRLTGSWVSGTSASEILSYDPMGRVLVNPQCTPSTCGNSSFMVYGTYDLSGNLTSTTTAQGATVTYAYNGASRLTSVTSSLNDAQHPGTLYTVDTSVGYWPMGGLHKALFGNNLTDTVVFNNRLQPCRMNTNSAGAYLSNCSDSTPAGNVLDFTNGYNAGSSDNGNVVSWSGVGNQTFSRSYLYDSLNRILSMTDSAPTQACQGMSWTIDAWGNMTAQTGTKGTCFNFSSAVGTNNQLQTGYQYDAAGNMTYDGVHHYTYDGENRITQVDGGSTAIYVYDAHGRRVRKSTGATFTEYSYGPNDQVQGEYNGSSWPAQYVYANGKLIAEYTNSTTEFIHSDHLGSTRLVTAVNQSLLDNVDYLPFGQQKGGSVTTHKFTGKERDSESSLDMFGARYYGSSLGRFMTPDWAAKPTAVPYAGFDNPQTLNLYSYVKNNPTTLTDPNGHCDVDGEHHGWVWCAAHAIGFTETKKEQQAELHQAAQNMRRWWADHGVRLYQHGNQVNPNNMSDQQVLGAASWYWQAYFSSDDGEVNNYAPAVAGAILDTASQIAGGHSWAKHQGEFPGWDQGKFEDTVKETMQQPDEVRSLSNNRTAYWNAKENMVVIENPGDPDGGTAFRPTTGKAYFDGLK